MEIDVTPDVKLEKHDDGLQCGEDLSEESQIHNIDTMSTTNCSYTDKNHGSSSSDAHSKKAIKHALRQQAKRRRKNTFASKNTTTVPRIIVKPLPPQPVEEVTPVRSVRTPTMKEVLASIPGFSMKPRKRSNKKLSTAAQLEQTKEGCIDLETPDSILVNLNLRALLNKYTFASLPPLYQNKLVQLLPSVDRPVVTNSPDMPLRLSTSGLNNEFFARACLEWQERLAEGEFTPENQQKLKSEADRERSRVDPWKLKHFEPIWGDRSATDDDDDEEVSNNVNSLSSRPPIKTTIKLRPTTTVSNKPKPAPLIKRLRTVGAVTRSCTNYRMSEQCSVETTNTNTQITSTTTTTRSPIPDLLPIRTHKNQMLKKEAALKQSNSETSIKFNSITPSEKTSEIIPDISIINISDTILKTNEETIISCNEDSRFNNNKLSDKRRRSPSSELEEQPTKRRTPSPISHTPEPETQPDEQIPIVYDESSQESETSHKDSEDDNLCINEEVEFPKEDYVDSLLEEAEDRNAPLETVSPLPEHIEQCENQQLPPVIIPSPVYTQEHTPIFIQSEMPQMRNETVELEQPAHYKETNQRDQTEQTDLQEPFEILPNTLILQQDSIVLDKTVCSENCASDVCLEDSEKLEATVEESDLVIAEISKTNFDGVGNIGEVDEANEDRFIDAENYVLESGQIGVPEPQKINKPMDANTMQTALFGATAVTTGNISFLIIMIFIAFFLRI